MLPITGDQELLAQVAETMDGFLFTGGQDVSPGMYAAEPKVYCGGLCPSRDVLEKTLFPLIRKEQKPVFGICRGLQMINVLLGGTLYQDLAEELPESIPHKQDAPFNKPAHSVAVLPNTPLAQLTGEESILVTSLHHQGIDGLGEGLVPMATAPDGLVEAVYLPGSHFIQAVQWHPELIPHTNASKKLFAAFVEACKASR